MQIDKGQYNRREQDSEKRLTLDLTEMPHALVRAVRDIDFISNTWKGTCLCVGGGIVVWGASCVAVGK